MTTSHEHPDGTRHWVVDPDVAEAAALAGEEDFQMSPEDFTELTAQMREDERAPHEPTVWVRYDPDKNITVFHRDTCKYVGGRDPYGPSLWREYPLLEEAFNDTLERKRLGVKFCGDCNLPQA